ncbi:MFS transporter [Herbaspirillum sp. YR522]|uniref:MFS transporter n=1 Tax=Herbaspirillum sp. YR522 TaxID=1144342 RepID=UPI00026F7672|nr:MFS transporter [Herbaspirillum sp. YR522]EJN08145.1 sugar phosphate permease [Herbaspirillum sp. YR522]
MSAAPSTAAAIPPVALAGERDATFARVIWRIVPCVTLIWFLAWVDRVNVGFAKLTMMSDLQWSDAIYGAGAGIFFIGYFLFEVPSNLLLQKIGARKTIMRITIGWGVICVAMAWVQTPGQFYFLRFMMGAFEAGLQPGVILYLTYWLPAHRRGKALSVFVSASAVSLMVGSPLAAYIMDLTQGAWGMKGWQWLFIVEGIPSVVMGLLAWFILTDLPARAKWLSSTEKEHIASELADEERRLGPRQHSFMASLGNSRIWLLIAVFFCIIAGNATLVFYGPSLVREVGFTDIKTLGWVMGGIYACGWAGMLVNGWLSDRAQETRLHTAAAAALGAIGLLAAAWFVGQRNPAGVVAALAVSSAGTMGAIPIFWQLPGQYLSGSAIAIGLAVINSVANLAGYFSPQLLGYLKSTTGSYTRGLTGIALVELLATVLILVFIARPVRPR